MIRVEATNKIEDARISWPNLSNNRVFKQLTRCLSQKKKQRLSRYVVKFFDEDIKLTKRNLRKNPLTLLSNSIIGSNVSEIATRCFFSTAFNEPELEDHAKSARLTNLRKLKGSQIGVRCFIKPFLEVLPELKDKSCRTNFKKLLAEDDSILIFKGITYKYTAYFNLKKPKLFFVPNFKILNFLCKLAGTELIPTFGLSNKKDTYELFCMNKKAFFLGYNGIEKKGTDMVSLEAINTPSFFASLHDAHHILNYAKVDKEVMRAYRISVIATKLYLEKGHSGHTVIGTNGQIKFPKTARFDITENASFDNVMDFLFLESTTGIPKIKGYLNFLFSSNPRDQVLLRREDLLALMINTGMYLQRETCYYNNQQYQDHLNFVKDADRGITERQILEQTVEKTNFKSYLEQAKQIYNKLNS